MPRRNKSTEVTIVNAKWTEERCMVFLELAEEEIRKGNKRGGTFTAAGWTNIVAGFTTKTELPYIYKQHKNHLALMKKDWELFKKLRRGFTGLGWDERKKTIDASEEWWTARIAENEDFKRFKGVDLSAIWFRYDALFLDCVATGENARAPSQRSCVGLNHLRNEDEFDMEDEEEGLEGSGSSDEDKPPSRPLFASSSLGKQKSSTSSGSKRKRSGADRVCDSFDGMMRALTTRSTSSTAVSHDPTLVEALNMLDNMDNMEGMDDLYHFSQKFLKNKDDRTIFMQQRDDNRRFNTLKWNYDEYKKNGGK